MIELPLSLLQEVISHAREKAPEEVCGWLSGEDGKVLEIHPIPNVAETPRSRFRMEPEAQLAAMRGIRERSLDLIGTYHSHPNSQSRPSAKDQDLALYPKCAHLIISLALREPEISCWSITREGFESLDLTFVR